MATIKILYVEDEANLGTIVSETLEQKGFDVRLIADGNLVLQACLTFKPDIAVLDVMLPGVDGFTIGKNLRLQF
ncbi:MAG TPA: response regulator, partial [Chitinophagales bacterium]|nr:response regulator [Chitinophagales bacterium]